MEREIIWQPQPRQAEALACPAFEVFFGGAKGGGKSDFLLGDYAAGIEEWGAAWRGILFRRTYKELDEIITRSKEIYGKIPGAKYVGGDQLTWYFTSGASLRFRALEREEDVSKYNGHQYPWIGWDELTEFPNLSAYIFMIGCCRSAAGAPCYVRATGNPGRPGHIPVKARFIDPAPPFSIYTDPDSGLTRCFIPSKLEDNQILMERDPDYEKRLLLQPKHLQKALRWGMWDVVVGQVFSEYDQSTHVIPRKPLDASWYRFCSMDWGYAKPFSIGWWAINDEGRMIRYKEWYGCETGQHNVGIRMSSRAVAQKAWDMSVDEGVEHMVADPACWIKTGVSDTKGEEVPSVAEAFESVGFKMHKANNDRVNGLARMHELLQTRGEDRMAFLLISETCTHWRRTVPYLTADPRNPEDLDTSLEDHAYDDSRYAIMSEFALNPRKLRKPERMRALRKHTEEGILDYGLERKVRRIQADKGVAMPT